MTAFSSRKEEETMFIDTVMHYLRANAAKGNEAAHHYLDSLKSAEHFRIDNIANYIHETDLLPAEDGPMDFDVPNEIPNVAPLADMMWFEMHGDLWERSSSNRAGRLYDRILHVSWAYLLYPYVPDERAWIQGFFLFQLLLNFVITLERTWICEKTFLFIIFLY